MTTTRITLTAGQTYDLSALDHVGWTRGDGSGVGDPPYGYQVADYFDADGRYLGPDVHGIEPTWEAAGE